MSSFGDTFGICTSRRCEAHHFASWAVWTDEAMSARLEITLVIHLAVSSGSSTERGCLASFLNTPGKGFPCWCDRIDTWDSLQVLWRVRRWMRKKMWNLKTWTKPREYKLVFNCIWIALFFIVERPFSRKLKNAKFGRQYLQLIFFKL